MKEHMAGPRLFLLYAWPSAEERFGANKIGWDEIAELRQLMDNEDIPETELLEKCFPEEVSELREFASQKGLDMWSLEAVAGSWRRHQGSGGDCAVQRLKIRSNRGVTVYTESGSLAFNFYQLNLREGAEVFAHRQHIVEIAPSSGAA